MPSLGVLVELAHPLRDDGTVLLRLREHGVTRRGLLDWLREPVSEPLQPIVEHAVRLLGGIHELGTAGEAVTPQLL